MKTGDYTHQGFIAPGYMIEQLNNYIKTGQDLGHFLTAVIENNLMRATARADGHNILNIPAYCAYLYNEAPSACHGSPEKVKAWQKQRREYHAAKANEVDSNANH